MSLHPRCLLARRQRRRTIDRTVPMMGKEKTTRMDLGLALLELVAKPGAPLTQDDIALWCGCTRGAIYMEEKRALVKLRNKIFFGRSRAIREELIA